VSGQTVYTYVGNDPLDRTDPSGNDFRDVIQGTFPELVTIGDDFAGDAAYLVGRLSGNDALANVAVDALSQSRSTNVNLAISLAATTRGAKGEPSGSSEGSGLTQRAATRAAKREAGIPTSQQPVSQSNNSIDGTNVGRQQTFETPKPGGGTEQKSVQVSRDVEGAHANQPQIEAGTVKPGGQTDAAGRPRIQNEGKVRVDFCPRKPQC
jgi:hypothetical protein